MAIQRTTVIGVRFLWGATEEDARSSVQAISSIIDSSVWIAPVWRFAPYWFAWFTDLPILPIVSTPLIDHLGRQSEFFLTVDDAKGMHALLAMTNDLSSPPATLEQLMPHSHHVTLWLDPYESACGDNLDRADVHAAKKWIQSIRAQWRGPIGLIRRAPGESFWRIARLRRFDAFAGQMHLIAMNFPEVVISPGMSQSDVVRRTRRIVASGGGIPAPPPSSGLTIALPSPTISLASSPTDDAAIDARRRLRALCHDALAKLPQSYRERFEKEERIMHRSGLENTLWTVATLGRLLRSVADVTWVRSPWNTTLTLFLLGCSPIDPVRANLPVHRLDGDTDVHVLVPSDYNLRGPTVVHQDGWVIAQRAQRPMSVRADTIMPHPHKSIFFPDSAPIPIHRNGAALTLPDAQTVTFCVKRSNILMGLRSVWQSGVAASVRSGDACAQIPYDIIRHPGTIPLFPVMRVPFLRALLEQKAAHSWDDMRHVLANHASNDAHVWEMLELTSFASSAMMDAPAHFLAPLLTCHAHPDFRTAARIACNLLGVTCIPPTSLLHVRTAADDTLRIQCGIDSLDGWSSDIIDRLETDIRMHGPFSSLPTTAARLAAIGTTTEGVESLITTGVLSHIDPDVAGWRRFMQQRDNRQSDTGNSLHKRHVHGHAP